MFALNSNRWCMALAMIACCLTATSFGQQELSEKEQRKVRSHAKNLSLAFNLAAEKVMPATVLKSGSTAM